MTDPLYARAAATSLRLLTKYGQAVTLRTITAGTYDPATGTNTQAPADTARVGALFDYTDQGREGQQYVRGNLVLTGDKQILVDATASIALTDRIVTAAGLVYSIVSVAEVNPAGTRVLYDIHGRVS